MKTLKLSFYNPNDVGDRFLSPTVEEIILTPETGHVSAKLSSGTVRDLGIILPKVSRNVIGARVVDGDLIISLTDSSPINVGRVTGQNSYVLPEMNGVGYHLGNGVFTTLTSGDAAVTVDDSESGVEVSINPAVTTRMQKYTYVSHRLTTATPATNVEVAYSNNPPASVWNNLPFNHIGLNEIGVALADGTLTLPAGLYRFDGALSTYGATYAWRLIDVASGETIYVGHCVNGYRDLPSNCTATGSGYFRLTSTRTIAMQYYRTYVNANSRLGGIAYVGGPMEAFVDVWHLELRQVPDVDNEIVGQAFPTF